jgi:Spy/CpxP family protein refolding chaperone
MWLALVKMQTINWNESGINPQITTLTNKGDYFMKTQRTKKAIIITSIILLVGSTIAFAQGGWGYGSDQPRMRGYGGHMMGPGYCGSHMRGNGPGWVKGGYGDLSEEEATKLEEAREKFYTETKDIRRQIGNLREDIRDEMVKDDPDSAKVLKMQKELSNIEADFDQKRVQHRLEMRKLVPEKYQGRGFGRGFGRGYGYGRGGHCWE